MAEWENDSVAVQDWQDDPPAESWKSDPVFDTEHFNPDVMQPPAQSSEELTIRNFYDQLKTIGSIPTREHSSLWQNATTPLVDWAQKMTPQEMQAHLTPQEPDTVPGTTAKVMAGVEQGAAEIINSFTSPLGIATLGLGAFPKAMQVALSGGFAAHMASTLPQQARQASAAIKRGDTEDAARVITGGVATLALAGLAGTHAAKGTKEILVERAAQVGPVTEAVVKGKEAIETPPQPLVAPAATAGEPVKPVEVAQPISTEPPLPIPSIEPATTQPAMAERITELRAVEAELLPQVPRSITIETPGGPRRITVSARMEGDKAVMTAIKMHNDATGAYEVFNAPAGLTYATLDEAGAAGFELARAKLSGTAPKGNTIDLIGMGGATPAEYVQTPQTPTGIKNRTVDAERAKRDLPPAMEAGKQTFGEAWDRAMARMDKDPLYQERLVAELGDKPRAVTDIEDATLLHRQVDLQNEYGKATRDLAQAHDDGRLEDAAQEQARVADLSDKLYELYTINQAVGTETGRGLAARKMMAYEDFSLAKMELEKRAAKGGEQLTVDERAQVVGLQNKIEATQKAYDAYVAKTQQQITALEVKAALAATTQKAQANVPPKILEIAKRIADNLHREADAARERIKERGIVFGSGPLHEIPNIKDFAIIGADHLVTGSVKFAEWSTRMVKEFGEGIKPHLETIFDESQKTLNTIDKNSPMMQPIRRARAKSDTQESKLSFEAVKAKKDWQQQLLEDRRSRLPIAQKAFGMAGEVLNTARALMTSFDLSAVLRQGGFIALAHPIRAAKSFGPMLRALQSEAKAHAVNLEIASRPNYAAYHQSKLYLSEHGHKLSQMEEAYMSRWAEKIPGVAHSQRAYTTFLNKLRADSFDVMEKTWTSNGKFTPQQAEIAANFINVATGRGSLGAADRAAVGLNTVFFAPRYVASRFQLLAGTPMWKGTAQTRTAIAKEYARYLMGVGVVYGLAKLAGGEIETDSRSSDSGKVRFGNTRIDPLSGLQQIMVLESRLASGETKRLSGKVVPIRGEKVPFGSPDASDVLKQFVRTKLSPPVGTAVDIVTGKNVVGEPVTPVSVAQNLTMPLAIRDIYEAMIEQGVPQGTAIALLSILGMGVQTYDK